MFQVESFFFLQVVYIVVIVDGLYLIRNVLFSSHIKISADVIAQPKLLLSLLHSLQDILLLLCLLHIRGNQSLLVPHFFLKQKRVLEYRQCELTSYHADTGKCSIFHLVDTYYYLYTNPNSNLQLPCCTRICDLNLMFHLTELYKLSVNDRVMANETRNKEMWQL